MRKPNVAVIAVANRFESGSAREFFDGMIANGIDHHILVKPGDVTGGLRDFCDLFDVQKVEL